MLNCQFPPTRRLDKLKATLPSLLPNPLARDAISEAELELLSWLDSPEGLLWHGVAELPLGRGREWGDFIEEEEVVREGAGRDAARLMRVMTQTYSVRSLLQARFPLSTFCQVTDHGELFDIDRHLVIERPTMRRSWRSYTNSN